METVEELVGRAEAHWGAGRREEALGVWERVVKAAPREAGYLIRYGRALLEVRRVDAAVRVFHQAVQRRPDLAEGYEALASGLETQARFDKAAEAYRSAMRLVSLAGKGEDAGLYHKLAAALGNAGKLGEAKAAFAVEARLRPAAAQPCLDVGSICDQLKKHEEAEVWYREATRREPANAAGWRWLGVTLGRQGKIAEGVGFLERAATLDPRNGSLWHDLGVSLAKSGQMEKSLWAYEKAVEADPGNPDRWQSYGQQLQEVGRADEGIATAEKALAMDPRNVGAHGTLAMAYLQRGELVRGFDEYLWRWEAKDFPDKKRSYEQPAWRGEDVTGKRFLLYPEQGLGDMIQFMRYAPLLARRGAKVIVEVPTPLTRLARSLAGVLEGGGQVIEKGSTPPAFDVHCPMLSVPRYFGTALETIPAEVPYLGVPRELVEQWGGRVAERAGGGPRVGLVWAGSRRHCNDKNRSIALELFGPLVQTPGVRFCSLQLGEPIRELRTQKGGELVDVMEGVNDMADTAAILQHMDLVIAVDTAVAHLAGALGRKVWVLLPRRPDWRWLLDREDSPWYPTMRLFRKQAGEEWAAVIERVRGRLVQERFNG